MDDAVLVGVREGVRQRAAGAQHLADAEPAAGGGREPGGERAAGHVARDDVQRAVVLDRVIDRHHVRVVAEARHQPRLAAHPLPCLRAGRARPGTGYGDRAIERQVVREPDLLRAAAPEHPLGHVAVRDQARRRSLSRGRAPRHRGARRARIRPRGQWAAARGAGVGGDVVHRRDGGV
jgi:hypothetical protein